MTPEFDRIATSRRVAAGAALLLVLVGACSRRDGGAGQADSSEPRNSSPAAAVAAAASDADAPTNLTRHPVEYYAAAKLSAVGSEQRPGRPTGISVSKHQHFIAIQTRRVASGGPEVHDDWTDVTIVQSGHATIIAGGTVTGAHLEPHGEHRGGTITGGAQYTLAPGDMIVVPAGMPHQFQLARGDTLRYLTIKVAPDVRP